MDKANKRIVGKTQLIGAKHLIWDQIIMEVTKFWKHFRIHWTNPNLKLTGNQLLPPHPTYVYELPLRSSTKPFVEYATGTILYY